MRLIDANKVEIGFEELCQSPYFKSDVNAKHGAETLMDLCVRSDSHKPNTIAPETLPIVQELREQLAKVTAEREAALMDMRRIFKVGAGCIICKRAEECEDRLFGFGDCPKFGWRGVE